MLTNLVAAPHARPQKPKLAKTATHLQKKQFKKTNMFNHMDCIGLLTAQTQVRTFEARGWPVQEEALSDSHVIVECFFSMGFPSSLHGSVRIHVGLDMQLNSG